MEENLVRKRQGEKGERGGGEWLTVCMLREGNMDCNIVAISLDGLSSDEKLFRISCK